MADNPSTTTPPSPSPSPSSPSPSSSFFQSLQAHATRFGSSAHSTLTHVVTNGITHLQGGIGNTNTANKQHIHPPPSHHDPIPPVKDGGHSSSSTTTTSTRSSLTSLVNHISLSSAVNHLSSTVRTSTQDGLNSLGKLVLDTAHSARNSISGVMGGNGNAVKDTSPSSTTTKVNRGFVN